MDVSRRKMLRFTGGGIAAAGVSKAANAFRTSHIASETSRLGQLVGGGQNPVPVGGWDEPEAKFKTFSDWLLRCGDGLKREAKHIDAFDPDIIEIHISLQGKRRMQINRNYKRLVAEKESSFLEVFERNGFVGRWL